LTPTACGYLTVKLSANGVAKTFRVHRLVAQAFLDVPASANAVVMHKDDDSWNCHYHNLQWGTTAENTADKVNKQRQARGKMLPQTKLTRKDVIKILGYLRNGHSHLSIARKFDVCVANIGCIARGETWSHITGIK
jgi:hypothetical protein